VVDYALDALFGDIDAGTLGATIAGELGSLEALERFVARPGRPDVRYAGVASVAIVASDTTIGVAVPPLAFALCAGARVAVKDRADLLVAAFAETLAEEWPELGARVTASAWDAGDAAGRATLAAADTVVAYGRDETLTAIRATLRPAARFVGFGHRTSVAYIAREHLATERGAREAARAAARDALLYDGEGCLSPHAIFVEGGAAIGPRAFALELARACDEVAVEFPAGYTELDPAAAAYRRAALFRASQGAGEIFAGVTAPHLVAFDPPANEPPPFLRRTAGVYPVDGPDDAAAYLQRHALPLEALAFAGEPRADLEAFAVASGAARIAPLGRLQRPPLAGEHGGVGRIRPFVRAMYRG
jgi:hypothetical protein